MSSPHKSHKEIDITIPLIILILAGMIAYGAYSFSTLKTSTSSRAAVHTDTTPPECDYTKSPVGTFKQHCGKCKTDNTCQSPYVGYIHKEKEPPNCYCVNTLPSSDGGQATPAIQQPTGNQLAADPTSISIGDLDQPCIWNDEVHTATCNNGLLCKVKDEWPPADTEEQYFKDKNSYSCKPYSHIRIYYHGFTRYSDTEYEFFYIPIGNGVDSKNSYYRSGLSSEVSFDGVTYTKSTQQMETVLKSTGKTTVNGPNSVFYIRIVDDRGTIAQVGQFSNVLYKTVNGVVYYNTRSSGVWCDNTEKQSGSRRVITSANFADPMSRTSCINCVRDESPYGTQDLVSRTACDYMISEMEYQTQCPTLRQSIKRYFQYKGSDNITRCFMCGGSGLVGPYNMKYCLGDSKKRVEPK